MNINFKRTPAKNFTGIISSKHELPFELDCTMPDYCRDIEKLLNTSVSPVVCSVSSSDNKITVDGNNTVSVYYVDNENHIAKYESKVPFNKTIEIKNKNSTSILSAEIFEGYVNCRAVSPRRLDIRGTSQLEIDCSYYQDENIINIIDEENMEVMKNTFDGAEFAGQHTKQFTLKENIELGDKNDSPLNIIRYCICPVINEHKLLPDKVILKGDLDISICYCEEKSKDVYSKDYKIPFSQIVDCPGADEESVCDCSAKVISSEISFTNYENGSKFIVSATMCADISVYRKVKITAVTDCFSHKCECVCKYRDFNVMKLVSGVENNFNYSETVSVEDCTEIRDVWCKPLSWIYEYDKKSLKVKIKACVCILGIKNKQFCCIEKPVSINCELLKNSEIEKPCFYPHITVTGCKFTDINSGKIDVICDIKITGIVFDQIPVKIIDDLKLDDKIEKEINKDCIIIHYAHAKESLWDIAKLYNTSPQSIKQQNNLKNDYLENGEIVLISPYKVMIQSAE